LNVRFKLSKQLIRQPDGSWEIVSNRAVCDRDGEHNDP
jgi:hypothetical protein